MVRTCYLAIGLLIIGLVGCGSDPEALNPDEETNQQEETNQEEAPELTVVTVLSENPVEAGLAVDVDCLVLNQDGATVMVETLVDAPAGVEVTDHAVRSEVAGTFEITCRLTEGDAEAEHRPANLMVTSAALESISARVSPERPA